MNFNQIAKAIQHAADSMRANEQAISHVNTDYNSVRADGKRPKRGILWEVSEPYTGHSLVDILVTQDDEGKPKFEVQYHGTELRYSPIPRGGHNLMKDRADALANVAYWMGHIYSVALFVNDEGD